MPEVQKVGCIPGTDDEAVWARNLGRAVARTGGERKIPLIFGEIATVAFLFGYDQVKAEDAEEVNRTAKPDAHDAAQEIGNSRGK